MRFAGNRKTESEIVRFELKNGKFIRLNGYSQTTEQYDYVEGRLVDVVTSRRSTKNGEIVFCDFYMKNEDDRFVISTLLSSGTTANLICRLKNVKDPANSMLRIDAWSNNIYTNIYIKENGKPVGRTFLPRVEKIERGLSVETDSSKRDSAVLRIIDEIKEKLQRPL